MAYLALVRHGESEWNAKGLWTGLVDVSLTKKGRQEARIAAENLEEIKFDVGFTSKLKRAKGTIEEIKKTLKATFPVYEDEALNERDYGNLTGKNKWEIKKQVGEEEFRKIRRGWNYPIPQGERLKDVYDRVVPYYLQKIKPRLLEGKNILVAAHGNSLRALIKYLENIKDSQIPNLELAIGEIYLYKIDNQGNIVSKEIKAINHNIP